MVHLDKTIEEISSNLEEPIKNEALKLFLESVKTGETIKDCIFKVQNEVLPKVPNERNKFFIKFTFDNQLEVCYCAIYLQKSETNKELNFSFPDRDRSQQVPER